MTINTHINIAQLRISKDPNEVLIASNLGSCLGICAYDPIHHQGGMVHCLLPLSKADEKKAAENPCFYVDTGFAKLLNELIAMGAEKRKLIICVAGGANINDAENVFEIGKKNYTILRKILWKNGLLLADEDTGGSFSRTISLSIATGRVTLKLNGETRELRA